MLNLSEFCDIFATVNFSSSANAMKSMQKFVIALYAKSLKVEDIDECRYAIYSSGSPIEKLPPTSAALLQHTRRAIYQVEILKATLTKIQNLPSPLHWGWMLDEFDQLVPFWTAAQPASSIHEIIHHCNSSAQAFVLALMKHATPEMNQLLYKLTMLLHEIFLIFLNR